MNLGLSSRRLLHRNHAAAQRFPAHISRSSAAASRTKFRFQRSESAMGYEDIVPPGAQAALFDVDGTLLDSNEHHVQSWTKAAADHGLNITREQYFAWTGMAGSDIAKRLAKEQGKDLSEEDIKDVVSKESEYFQAEGLPKVQPVGVVLELVKEAQRRKLKMGVVSGGEKDTIEKALEERGLKDAFEVIVTSKEVEHAKPEPDIFCLAAERLGVPASKCVAYEDAPLGLKSAERAGCMAVVDVTRLEGHPEKEREKGAKRLEADGDA